MNRHNKIAIFLSLLILAVCFFEFGFRHYMSCVREYETLAHSFRWILLSSLSIWCCVLIFLTRRMQDWLLVGFLLLAAFLHVYTRNSGSDMLLLLFCITVGKGVSCFLQNITKLGMEVFLLGLIGLLTFASWWHLDMSDNYYHGPRWMGLWGNPNIYGMLMGAGVVLTAGLLLADERWKKEDNNSKAEGRVHIAKTMVSIGLITVKCKSKMENIKLACFLCLAGVMMGVGLVMSYSRGAWLATAVGLMYLAFVYGKFQWRYVVLGVGLLALAVLCLWGSTPDSAPWYVKRADLGRPSAQNRVAAWLAGLKIMTDHPLGVGWNNAVKIYWKKYSSPEGGAPALTTNDYLMLGTELGIPALLCFMAYVWLCFKGPKLSGHEHGSATVLMVGCGGVPPPVLVAGRSPDEPIDGTAALRCACRAGVIAFLVAFWFDGGLFKLPTAAMFWVLLELGAARGGKVDSRELTVDSPKT